MKKSIFGFLAIGLFVTLSSAEDIKIGQMIQSGDEVSCKSFNDIATVMEGLERWGREQDALLRRFGMQDIFRSVDCDKITEGMDLKIIKVEPFEREYGKYSKGLLVKLPTGMTAWIGR